MVHLPQNGTIGFDPQPGVLFLCNLMTCLPRPQKEARDELEEKEARVEASGQFSHSPTHSPPSSLSLSLSLPLSQPAFLSILLRDVYSSSNPRCGCIPQKLGRGRSAAIALDRRELLKPGTTPQSLGRPLPIRGPHFSVRPAFRATAELEASGSAAAESRKKEATSPLSASCERSFRPSRIITTQ